MRPHRVDHGAVVSRPLRRPSYKTKLISLKEVIRVVTYIRLALCNMFTTDEIIETVSSGTLSHTLNASISFFRISLPDVWVRYVNGSRTACLRQIRFVEHNNTWSIPPHFGVATSQTSSLTRAVRADYHKFLAWRRVLDPGWNQYRCWALYVS